MKVGEHEMSDEASRRPEGGAAAPTLHTVEKAIKVLECVVTAQGAVGVTEIAREVGINASTVYRILSTFKSHGFVTQDRNNRYFAGNGLLKLIGPVLARLEPRKAARPVMERLAKETGESVNLMVPDGDYGVYVDSVQGSRSIRMVVDIGMRERLHCSSVGKAILAFLPQSVFERLASAGFPKLTPNTITDADLLAAHLKLVRERGYAIDDEEGEEGTRCVGAPIFDGAGEIVGAISVAGPAFRMSMSKLETYAPIVKAAATEISQRLGFVQSR